MALREYTDPRAELVGVVDSDYQLDPDFLRRCAPLFADEGVGFIQAPQDYRDWEQAPYFRRLHYSYKSSSRSRSRPATSTTAPSSPARWG